MPKKPEEEEKKETSEVVETKDGGVEVSIEEEEKEETPQVEVEEEEEEEKEEITEEKPKKDKTQSFRNKVYAQDRIINKLQKEIEELKKQPKVSSASTEETAKELDEIDKLAEKDWKAAVGKIVEFKAKELLKIDKEQLKKEREQEEVNQILDKNTERVRQRHPELDDPTSEKSQIFLRVLESNPRWKNSPDGPLLVMREMEDELRSKGYDVDGSIKKAIESEQERFGRASSTALSGSRRASSSNKVVLSKEQKDFCDEHGISYADYARTLRIAEESKGVEA